MNLYKSTFYFLLWVLPLTAIPAMAQEEEGPSSLLPEIDPQDIEIRGDFDARFPGLSRQPILGFSPRTPVYRVDPDRMPFIESDEEIVSAIPISDLEPALKPEQRFIQFAERRRVFGRTGFGSYRSPELKLFAETPIDDNESVAMNLSHLSSEGDREYSSFRDMDGGFQWTRQSGDQRWGFGVTGASGFHHSPDPDVTLPVTLPTGRLDSSDVYPRRASHSSFGLEGRWQQLVNAYRGWQTNVSVNRYANDGGLLSNETINTNETRYRLHVNRFWEGAQPEQVFGIQANSAAGFYDTVDDNSQYWLTNNVGARYRQLFGHLHQVQAWLRVYQLYDPVNEFDLYLYPDIRYEYQGTGRVSAEVRVRGFVNDPSLERLNSKNRFLLQHGKDLEHERGLHIGLYSDVNIMKDTKVSTGLDYWQYYNIGYFSRNEAPENPFYGHEYTEEAIHVEWSNSITHFLSRFRTTAMLEVGLNYSGIDEELIPSGEIPYVPRWRGSAHIMARPVNRLDVSAWLDFRGERNTESEGETIGGYTQIGVQTDLRLHKNLGLYFKALNILNQDHEVWKGYQERPIQIYGGLTFHW